MDHGKFIGVATVLAVVITVGSVLSCASPAPPAPTNQPAPTKAPAAAPTTAAASAATPALSGDLAAGKTVFDASCSACHPGGNAGVGPAVKGKSQDDVKKKVRSGGGAMPAFGPGQISDQQLDALASYVNSLK